MWLRAGNVIYTTTITAQGEWQNTAGFTVTSSGFCRSGGKASAKGRTFSAGLINTGLQVHDPDKSRGNSVF
jgi:hypothetical protein